MRLTGTLSFGDSKINYYSEDNYAFFMDNQRMILMGEEYLRELALWANSPLNPRSRTYTIELVEKNNWVCTYFVESLGSVNTILYGYGVSEVDALVQCHSILSYLQEKYNPEDAAIAMDA